MLQAAVCINLPPGPLLKLFHVLEEHPRFSDFFSHKQQPQTVKTDYPKRIVTAKKSNSLPFLTSKIEILFIISK